MKVTQLPSGSWRAQVYLGKDENGKKIKKSITRATKEDCMIEAGLLAKHHHETAVNPGTLTLGEAIDKYIEMKSNILSPATIRGYSNVRRNHLQPEMNMQIRKITNHVAQRAINREAQKHSAKTVANVFGVLRPVVKEFAGMDLKVSLPQKENTEPVILNTDQCKQLIHAVDGDPIEIPVLLALFLGLRRSEIMALTFGDWDSDNRLLHVNKAMVPNADGHFVQKTTKTTKSRRTLPVPEYLAEKLDSCVENNTPFCPIHVANVGRRLTGICKQRGLPSTSLHKLRHQNASFMLMLGAPDKYAMERGGWSSNQTMKQIYQHTLDQKRNEINDNITNFFQGLSKK